ncbi:hypothetical protein [Nocardia asteroides]|uniref:hypothetical protein n=1 Tax=Nocardia asteroides TaxID=1824 RepID=UPI001E646508|nr:hypothetical protein [Nocardia asteroides]UGT62386.1 hypothetical protein LTT61_03305 [Nocardia asteroides]
MALADRFDLPLLNGRARTVDRDLDSGCRGQFREPLDRTDRKEAEGQVVLAAADADQRGPGHTAVAAE